MRKNKYFIVMFLMIFFCTTSIPSCMRNTGEEIKDKGDEFPMESDNEITLGEITVESENERSKPGKNSFVQIENEKIELFRILDEYYDTFCSVACYFESMPGRYVVQHESGELKVTLFPESAGYQIVDLSDLEICDEIEFIMNDLGFESIGEGTCIEFNKLNGGHPNGGSYIQGLAFNTVNAGIYKLEEWKGSISEYVHIRDEWYYYLVGGSG